MKALWKTFQTVNSFWNMILEFSLSLLYFFNLRIEDAI